MRTRDDTPKPTRNKEIFDDLRVLEYWFRKYKYRQSKKAINNIRLVLIYELHKGE